MGMIMTSDLVQILLFVVNLPIMRVPKACVYQGSHQNNKILRGKKADLLEHNFDLG